MNGIHAVPLYTLGSQARARFLNHWLRALQLKIPEKDTWLFKVHLLATVLQTYILDHVPAHTKDA